MEKCKYLIIFHQLWYSMWPENEKETDTTQCWTDLVGSFHWSHLRISCVNCFPWRYFETKWQKPTVWNSDYCCILKNIEISTFNKHAGNSQNSAGINSRAPADLAGGSQSQCAASVAQIPANRISCKRKAACTPAAEMDQNNSYQASKCHVPKKTVIQAYPPKSDFLFATEDPHA